MFDNDLIKGISQSQFERDLAKQMMKNRNHVNENMQAIADQIKKLESGDYMIVPKEPTQRMLNAGHVVMNPVKGSDVHSGTNQKRKNCYKAMLSAYEKYGDLNDH